MGVRGLTGFIDRHRDLLHKYRLCNSSIVVDGYNLLYHIYYYYNINCAYGGDYDNFAQQIEIYFRAFLDCGIKPVVVIDGADEEMKLLTQLRRQQDRLGDAIKVSKGIPGFLLPILALEVFINILKDLQIDVIACSYEADAEVAILANHLKCPVLSEDSDFYVFNLLGGFISVKDLDTFDILKASTKDAKDGPTAYMNTRIYFMEELCKQLSFKDVREVALWASLMGNDYVNKNFELQNFHSSVGHHEGPIRKKDTVANGIMQWVKGKSDIEDAISSVLRQCKIEDRPSVEQGLRFSLKMYDLPPSQDSALVRFFVQNENAEFHSELTSKNGCCVPRWVVDAFYACNFPEDLWNVLLTAQVFLKPQVERFHDSISVYEYSLDLRQAAYGILFGHREVRKTSPPVVLEYARKGTNIKKSEVESRYILDSGVALPLLEDIPELSLIERQQLFWNILKLPGNLGDKLISIFPYGFTHVGLVSLVYLMQHKADSQIQACYVQAFILCLVLKAVIVKPEVVKIMEGLPACERHHMAKSGILERLSKPRCSRSIPYDLPCVHFLSQVQACYKEISQLNALLLFPLAKSRIDYYLNGTVIYNIAQNLKSGPNVSASFIDNVFKSCPSFKRCFENVLQFVTNFTPVVVSAKGNHQKKKTKKNKKKESVSTKNTNIHQLPTGVGAKANKETILPANVQCPVSNKFSVLSELD